jgi:hypothetical protein
VVAEPGRAAHRRPRPPERSGTRSSMVRSKSEGRRTSGFLVLQAAASPRSRQDGPVSRCASAARLPDGVVMPAG